MEEHSKELPQSERGICISCESEKIIDHFSQEKPSLALNPFNEFIEDYPKFNPKRNTGRNLTPKKKKRKR